MVREKWIDVLRGIGIIFVIAGHLISYESFYTQYIFSFHIPLFFFISGYCFSYERYKNSKQFLKSRFNSLIIPYLIFILVGLLITISQKNIDLSIVLQQVFYYTQPEVLGVGQLWFLVCLFFTELTYYYLNKVTQKPKNIIFVLLCCAITSEYFYIFTSSLIGYRLPWKLDVIPSSIVFYGLGNILRTYLQKKSYDHLLAIKTKTLSILLMSLFINIFCGLIVNRHVNMCDAIYNKLHLFFLAALAGIIFYVIISKMINNNIFLEFLGRNSLIIFSVHSFFMLISIKIINAITRLDYHLLSMPLLPGLIATIITLLFITPAAYITNKFIIVRFFRSGLVPNLDR